MRSIRVNHPASLQPSHVTKIKHVDAAKMLGEDLVNAHRFFEERQDGLGIITQCMGDVLSAVGQAIRVLVTRCSNLCVVLIEFAI